MRISKERKDSPKGKVEKKSNFKNIAGKVG